MSTEIDNRVVQMEFDNKQFERGVRETMNTLDEFKKSLSFDKVSGSTEELSKRFDALEKSIDALKGPILGLSNAFTSLWGTIKRHTLDKVAQEIESFAARAIRAISFEGVSSGKTKYEEKLNSMRTIMNATGKSADEVQHTLDKLSDYSDATSYSFSEMTSYIGNFTSVGLQLEESEEAMEGIANAAARAGINTSEAGRAMREFAQAMSVGKMDRVNFRTLESMNFATAEFKRQVLEAAEARGILRETSDGVYQIISGQGRGKTVDTRNFADMLHYGFMTREVMMDVLRIYGNQNNELGRQAFQAAKEAKTFKDAIDAIKDSVGTHWANAWEKVFGNVDEAAQFFTELCDTVIETTDAILIFVETLLDGWRENGGRESMIRTLRDVWQLLLDIGMVAKDAWVGVFGGLNSSMLVDATRAVENFVRSVRTWLYTRTDSGYYRIERITQIVQGLLSVLKIGKLIIGGFFRFIGRAFAAFLPEGTLDMFGDLGLGITDFANRLEQNDTIGKWFENVGDTVGPVVSFIGHAIIDLIGFIKNGWEWLKGTDLYKRISAWVSEFIRTLPEKWDRFKTWITTTWNNIKNNPIVKAISDKLKEFFNSIPEKWDRIKQWFSTTIDNIKKSPAYQAIKTWITNFIRDLPSKWEKIKTFFTNVYNNVKNSELWKSIKKWFSDFFASIPGTWNKIKTWFSTAWTEGGGTIGGFFKVVAERVKTAIHNFIAGIPAWWAETQPKLIATWEKIKKWFGEKFQGIVSFFTNLFGGTNDKVQESAEAMSGTEGHGAGSGPDAANTWFGHISKLISDWWKGFPLRAALYVIGAFVLIWKIASMFKSVSKTIRAINGVKINESVAKKRWAFAAIIGTIILSIVAVAGLFLILQNVDVGKIIAGVLLLVGLVAGIIIAAKVIKTQGLNDAMKAFGEAGMGLLAISAAIFLIIPSILAFAAMGWGTFFKGFGLISVILLAFTGILVFISKFGGKNAPDGENAWKSIASSIISMAIAVDLIVIAVRAIGNMPIDKAAIGVGAVVILLTALAGAMWLISKSMVVYGTNDKTQVKTITGSVLAMALVIKILTSAAKSFSEKDIGSAAIGVGSVSILLLAFAGAMAIMGKAAKDQTTKSMISFAIMAIALAGIIFLFTEAIKQIEGTDWEVIAAFGGTLVGLLLAISLVAAVSKVMTLRSALVIVAIFAAVAAGLVLIGLAITVIIALGSTVMSTFCSSLSLLGSTLSLFDRNTEGIDRAHMDDIFAIIREFATIMLEFISVDFRAVENFSTQTYRIGVVLNSYNREVGSINYNSMERSIGFIRTVGSVSNTLTRIRNLDKIPRVISSMGSAIKLYYRNLRGIEADDISNGENVNMTAISTMIQRLAASLPADSDIERISAYTDNGSLAQLAIDIVSLGEAISSLSDSTGNSSRESVDYAIDILNQISELAVSMPEDEEIETAFGTLHRHYYSLSSFAVDIEALARGLTALSDCFGSEEGKANVTSAIEAIREIANIRRDVVESSLGDNLTALGAWLQGIAANSAWNNFVSSIGLLGDNVAMMANRLDESAFDTVEDDDISKLIRCVGAIADIYGSFARVSSARTSTLGITALLKATAESNVWNNFVNKLPDLAASIATLATEFSDSKYANLDENGLDNVERIISAIARLYGSVSLSSVFTDFGTQFADISYGLSIMAETMSSDTVRNVTEDDVKKISKMLTMISLLFSSVRNEGNPSSDGINGIFTAIGGDIRWTSYVNSFPAIAYAVSVLSEAVIRKTVRQVTSGDVDLVTSMLEAIAGIYNSVTDPLTGDGGGLNSIFQAMGANRAWTGFVGSFGAVAFGISSLAETMTSKVVREVTSDDVGMVTSMLEAIAGIYNSITDPLTGDGRGLDSLFQSMAANNAWTGFVGSFHAVAKGVWEIADVTNSESFSNVVDYDITRIEKILRAIAGVYNSVTDPFTGDGQGLDSLFQSMAANNAWTGFVGSFRSVAEGVTELATVATSDTVREVEDADISTVTSILDMIQRVYSSVTSPITNSQRTGLSNLLTAVGANSSWNNFVDKFPDVARNTDSFVTTIRGLNLNGADSDSIRIVSSILTMIASVYDAVYTAKAKYLHEHNAQNAWNIIGAIIAPWTWIGTSSTADSNGDWNSFIRSLDEVGQHMGSLITSLRGSGINELDAGIVVTFFGAIGDLFESLMNGAARFADTVNGDTSYTEVKGVIEGFIDALSFDEGGRASDLGEVISGFFGKFISSIQDGVVDADGNTINMSDALATYEQYQELFDFFIEMMGFIGSFASGLNSDTNYLRSINNLNYILGGNMTSPTDGRQAFVDGLVPEILRGMARLTHEFSSGDFDPSVLSSASEMLDEFIAIASRSLSIPEAGGGETADSSLIETLRGLGASIDTNIASAMEDEMPNAFDSVIELLVNYITGTAPAFANLNSRAFDIGRNVDLGIKEGIARWKRAPLIELVSLIRSMVDAATSLLDIHSPSRVMAAIGRNIDAGLARGIRKDSKDPKNKMASMVDALFDVTTWVAPSLADGVLSEADKFANAMTALGAVGVEALRDELDIHSISPTLRDTVGAFIPISVAAGVDAKSPIFTRAMRNLALDGTQHFVMAAEFDTTGYVRNFTKTFTGSISSLLRGGLAGQDSWNSMFRAPKLGLSIKQREILTDPVGYMERHGVGSGGNNTSSSSETTTGTITAGNVTIEDPTGILDMVGGFFGADGINIAGVGTDLDLYDVIARARGVEAPGENATEQERLNFLADSAETVLRLMGVSEDWLRENRNDTTGLISTMFQVLSGNGSSIFGSGFQIGQEANQRGVVRTLLNILGLEDVDAAVDEAVSQVTTGSTSGSSSTGGSSRGYGGSSGSSLGNNDVQVSPGGLILNPTDGYTIGDILTRIDRLENAITRMVIVLDTGVVAGQMAPAIDSTIGGYIALNGRWN